MRAEETAWWRADKGDVHKHVVQYVQDVEREQGDIFERFVRLSYLYNPNERGPMYGIKSGSFDGQVSENLIASNVDTVYAAIGATDIRARFVPDGGDWSAQRRAKHLEWYANALSKKIGAQDTGRRAFKDSPLKGTAVVKVWIDEFKQVRCERLLIDDIIVDESEVRGGRMPRQMHHRQIVTRDEARARFPKFEEEIDAVAGERSTGGMERYWAEYRPLEHDDVVIIESWYLPLGVNGQDGYKPGRHCITISGTDLLDEKWEEDFFPVIWCRWSDPDRGWYGIGLAERIAGHQREVNRINWQRDRIRQQFAMPTTYVRQADAALTVKTIHGLGNLAVYKTEIPKTIFPPASSPDTVQRHHELNESAYNESGVSRMAAQSKKPSGLDSGVALREYRDQATQRFAQQEKAYEQFQLTIIERIVWCCKKLGKDAPEVISEHRHKPRIKWADVDMGEVRVNIQAASNISKTPAGRLQLALEWAQAGVITTDEARKLSEMPDTDRTISLYNAGMDRIDQVLEEGLDGEEIVPEPYMNLRMAVWRGQMTYQQAAIDDAPEDVLENVRTFIVQAADLVAMQEQPPMGVDPMAAESAALPAAEAVMPAPTDVSGPTLTGAGVTAANLRQ